MWRGRPSRCADLGASTVLVVPEVVGLAWPRGVVVGGVDKEWLSGILCRPRGPSRRAARAEGEGGRGVGRQRRRRRRPPGLRRAARSWGDADVPMAASRRWATWSASNRRLAPLFRRCGRPGAVRRRSRPLRGSLPLRGGERRSGAIGVIARRWRGAVAIGRLPRWGRVPGRP